MDAVKDNYYILLELPFDPPVTDPARIRSALHRKKQEWTRAQDNPARRVEAQYFMALAPEIEKAMLDPVSREQQAVEAQQIRDEMLRQFEAELRILESKGYLLPAEVTAICRKYRVYGVDRQMVTARAKCPIADAAPESAVRVEHGEVMDRVTAKAVRRCLAVLQKEDLYQFLGEAPYASIKKLGDAAEQRRKEAQQSPSKNAEAAAMQELAGICRKLFTDFHSKQRYDRYLKVSGYPALNDLIDEEATRSGYIGSAVLLRLVNFAVETCGIGVLDAEEHIRSYCDTYGIPVNIQNPRIACPACGEQVSREASACTSCAAPLRGDCPECGTDFSDGMAVCSACGFQLSGMVKALRYLDDAQNALIESNWGTAQRNVQYAAKYWPNHPQIEVLEKRARSLEDRYSRYVDSIADCVRHNQYYAALELVEEAEARKIRLPGTTVDHVRKAVSDLERRVGALSEKYGDALPPFEEVYELACMVEDSIELSRMMVRHAPTPPVSLAAQLVEGEVRLSWEQSAAPGVKDYVLVRKANSLPLTAYDGDILYEGPASSFVDRTAGSLKNLYYSVFCKRGGAYSEQSVNAGPVLLIPEIEGLRILPTDQGAQLSWDLNQDMREIIIWRKLGGEKPTAPGEGIRLENARLDGFSDHKIKNDVEYWYYLVASYVVDGRKVYSRGICEGVTPHKMLAPAEQLIVVASDTGEDEYVANWQSSDFPDVMLLASTRKPRHRAGDVLPVQELLAQYRKVNLEFKRDESARFQLSFSGGIYLFLAVPFGKFVTVGQNCYVTNVRNVEQLTCDVIGGDLYLNMKWPAGLAEIQVSHKADRFPEGPDDNEAVSYKVTKDQYDYDAAVVIREPEHSVYWFKIYSVFTTPEGDRVYSEGAQLKVDNTQLHEVFYKFRSKNKLFSRESNVSITVAATESVLLPPAVFVGKTGHLPLSRNDGTPLFEIERETRINGEITYQYSAAKLPENLYVRMFLNDSALCGNYRLLPASPSKIT